MKNTKTILFIDDDAEDKMFFSEAVKELNADIICHTASDGEEGMSFLKDAAILPDYIFLDLKMAKMDGLSFLAEIKKTKWLAGIPVIIFSAVETDEVKAESTRLGGAHFLKKPNTISAISAAVELVLNSEFQKQNARQVAF